MTFNTVSVGVGLYFLWVVLLVVVLPFSLYYAVAKKSSKGLGATLTILGIMLLMHGLLAIYNPRVLTASPGSTPYPRYLVVYFCLGQMLVSVGLVVPSRCVLSPKVRNLSLCLVLVGTITGVVLGSLFMLDDRTGNFGAFGWILQTYREIVPGAGFVVYTRLLVSGVETPNVLTQNGL